MNNRYAELRKKQQEVLSALPINYAFGNSQFDEMMQEWGLDPDADVNKIYSIGNGGYIRKTDADLMHKTFDRLHEELQAAIAEDASGDGFIYEMFLCELADHEYGYTQDIGETLDALGYTVDDIQNNPRLKKGLQKAAKKISGSAVSWLV